MTRLFTFSLDRPEMEAVRFVLQRETLPCNGDLESTFLEGITELQRHAANASVGLAAKSISLNAEAVVVIRNPDLVLDDGLLDAITAGLSAVADIGDWALAGAGGLGTHDRRHLALYASQNPVIPENAGLQPLTDLMPDFYLVNAEFLRACPDDLLDGLEHALEPALAVRGYLQGRVSVFVPALCAGINGELLSRDFTKVLTELTRAFSDRFPGQSIHTLSGPVVLETKPTTSDTNSQTIDVQASLASVIASRSDTPSISIITRTRFDRLHLLRRMLTSVSRARLDDMPLEIVLCTDTEPSFAEACFKELQSDFVNLTLRLKLSPGRGHSRVTNLLAGIQVASGEYLFFLDDDDYLDMFAFEIMRTATFAGNRPVIALCSNVHEETWEETPSGRWILSHSAQLSSYPASGWRDMFRGVNKMPICGLVFSRKRLRARLKAVPLRHDLSEDYALFLLMLTDPDLASIHECVEPAVHISVRGSENSILMPDRRPWVRDITRFLADLTQPDAATGAGQWLLHAVAAPPVDCHLDDAISQMQQQLDRRAQEIRLLRNELQQLRCMPTLTQENAA